MACHASALRLAGLSRRRREEHDDQPAGELAWRQRLAQSPGITAGLHGLLRRLLGSHGGVLRELLGRGMLSGGPIFSPYIFAKEIGICCKHMALSNCCHQRSWKSALHSSCIAIVSSLPNKMQLLCIALVLRLWTSTGSLLLSTS